MPNTSTRTIPNPTGMCCCGCGGITPLASKTTPRLGMVLGEHTRFIPGHRLPIERPVQQRGGPDYHIDPATSCWVWDKAVDPNTGYGRIRAADSSGAMKNYYAHRYFYLLAHGLDELPRTIQIHHTCRNRRCVNPRHLEAARDTKHRVLHFEPLGTWSDWHERNAI